MQEKLLRRLVITLIVFIIFGTLGFYIAGHDLWISFFSTVIILLSHFKHGIEEPIGEQILTISLILGSYFIFAYIIKGAAEYFFGGQFKESRRKKKMAKAIEKMKDHYIVCGYGRVGKQVAQELKDEGVEFVVVDRNPVETYDATKGGMVTVEGDPIKEDTLKQAGIANAKSLLAALGDDTDNLFLTLTARSLNPDLYIVARASEEENVSKLEKAGADKVALPYQIGGYHMAAVALRPAVVDFLDVIVDGKHTELQIEEINVEKGSKLIGLPMGEYLSKKKTGATVLAVNKADGVSKINPDGNEIVHRGDQLIVMGTRAQLEQILNEVS